jgi:hypothetical protein
MMPPQATFEYTFTEAGDYPYFCILHPNMVGNVSVGLFSSFLSFKKEAVSAKHN